MKVKSFVEDWQKALHPPYVQFDLHPKYTVINHYGDVIVQGNNLESTAFKMNEFFKHDPLPVDFVNLPDEPVMSYPVINPHNNQIFPNDYQDYLIDLSQKFGVYEESDGTQVFIYGVAEEAGEVLGLFKRLHRGDYENSPVKFQEDLEGELGDLLGYLALLASKYGLSLADIMFMNLEKIRTRYTNGTLKGKGSKR